MAAFDYLLVKGVAELLASRGLGVWREGSAYVDGETAITYRHVPDSPASVITLTPYPVADAPNLSSSTTGLQVRVRGADANPASCDDVAGEVFDVLHGLTNVELSTGIRLAQVLRRSGTSLGQDAARRWSHSDNYYLDLNRPSTHRP